MTLSDKEIALELTKITVEHFNIRVAQSVRQSVLTEETIRHIYGVSATVQTLPNGRLNIIYNME